ncbi:MBL fold metallo-hydrolase [Chitinophaga lutea]
MTTAIVTLAVLLLLILAFRIYLRRPAFGQPTTGARLERMRRSAHFKHGKFENEHFTPQLTEGYSMAGVLYEFLFKKRPGRHPDHALPILHTNLQALSPQEDVLVWFGHSSYFLQVAGKKFLVDPVFSGNASPIPGSNRAFAGTDGYTAADMPDIDFLIITHDHYDHMDYPTLSALRPKVRRTICGLGVGAHLERWGYQPDSIAEADWHEDIQLADGVVAHVLPARHFSGRSFSRNATVWMSILLETPDMKIYLGGDSGYDTHFAEIGHRFGSVDLALLDNGQYDPKWRYIHMLPEEVVQAGLDLKARRVFPVHSGKFALANHPWQEPLTRVSVAAEKAGLPLLTPQIGERVDLRDLQRPFKQWWT